MNAKLSIAGQAWLASPDVRAVMEALGIARLVGGCVRNSLLGLEVDDIDIATPLTPDAVAKAVSARGMKAIDTGAEHGTLTVILNSRPYEVTTLRRDVSTDGRRATVAFTTAWEDDAARRDFTINALYADIEGQVFDYHHGVADLQVGLVRFIGDADMRIAEDHLRILRLFRIHAWYGRGEIDGVALRASRDGRSKIRALSGERIQKEMIKLLRAQRPVHSVRSMRDIRVLDEVVPGDIDIEMLSRLCEIDIANKLRPDPILRLGAIMSGDEVARQVASRWRLSNDDRADLMGLFKPVQGLAVLPDLRTLRRLLYRQGQVSICRQVLMAWARSGAPHDDPAWRGVHRQALAWVRPRLGVDGADVQRAGVPEGPRVGQVLQAVESWWVDADFPEDLRLVQERLRHVIDGHDAS